MAICSGQLLDRSYTSLTSLYIALAVSFAEFGQGWGGELSAGINDMGRMVFQWVPPLLYKPAG